MANIKDCPGFETFGADVKEARKVKQLSRKTLAEQGPFKFNRRMTKRRVHDNPLFCFWEDAICVLSFFVRFSEKPGFCGYFLGGRTLFKGRRTKTASIGSVATLPANGFPFVSWGSPQTPE